MIKYASLGKQWHGSNTYPNEKVNRQKEAHEHPLFTAKIIKLISNVFNA